MAWRGKNVTGKQTVDSGRLKGYTQATSDGFFGMAGALRMFYEIAGRLPKLQRPSNLRSMRPIDRFISANSKLEVVFRPSSRSGGPVVEIIDHEAETYEKVHF